jgi:tetratricopeptide (TPR) repeat protein
MLAMFMAFAAHAASEPFGAAKAREREERAAIVADSGGDAAKATDLALRRALYFRALGAYETGARLAAYAATRSDGATRASALLESAYLYTMAGQGKAAAAATAKAAALVEDTAVLARARLAIQQARTITDTKAQLAALASIDADGAPTDVRFVVAAARSVVFGDAKRFDAARTASDVCWSLIESVDTALPEHLSCLQQRIYVLHALDVDGNESQAVAQTLIAWLEQRVGKNTPAPLLALLNWCNLSYPENDDYAHSERACARARKLLEHPDVAGLRRDYAFQLALGHGLAIQNQTGRVREALPHLSQALSLATLEKNAEDVNVALVNLGWAQFQAGDAPAAKPLLERVLRDAPDSPYALPATLSLGDIACNEGAYTEARRRFEAGKALALKIEGDTSPRHRHFVQRLEMLDGSNDDERCNQP